MRTFETGATRDDDAEKPDYEGFMSPLVVERFGAYMAKHRIQADGSVRASDNWQKGIPREQYIKSAMRHMMDWWKAHRGYGPADTEEALCALMFNVMGALHETLKVGWLYPDKKSKPAMQLSPLAGVPTIHEQGKMMASWGIGYRD